MFLTTRTGGKFTAIDLAPAKVMREIGEGLLTRIRRRTESGVDSDGRSFRPLSRSYAKAKRRALGHSRADLTVSGRMLNDMLIRPKPAKLAITFASGGSIRARGGTFIQRSRSISASDKAFWHNESGAGRSQVIRRFFDLSDDDADFAIRVLDAHLKKEIR